MKKFCLLAFVLISSGCMHAAPASVKQGAPAARPELSASLVSEAIVKGKTTKEEIVATFGPPNSVEKHPYHVPKITAPGFKMEIPPAMMAVETWNYWKPSKVSAENVVQRVLLVKVHIDETGKALDYEISEKEVKDPSI